MKWRTVKCLRLLYLLLFILPLGGCVSTPIAVLNPEWVKQQEDSGQKLKELRDAAKRGDAEAQYLLWWEYCGGVWIDSESDATTLKKREEGIKWLHKAAEQGHARAQCNLGFFYLNGTYGMPAEPTEAEKAEVVKWFHKAADNGNDDAMALVGWCYREGFGVPQDQEEAVRLSRKAAELGNGNAMLLVGWCYYEGLGVSQDKEEAIRWYLKADANGDVFFAARELMRCYIRGEYDPGEEIMDNWIYGLRKWVEWAEHADEIKKIKKSSDGMKKAIEEYAELLREVERIRKSEPQQMEAGSAAQ